MRRAKPETDTRLLLTLCQLPSQLPIVAGVKTDFVASCAAAALPAQRCACASTCAAIRWRCFIESRRRGPGIILVTHHVEEITPAFTHLLLLAGGRVAAAGPLPRTLTTAALNRAFATPLRLRRTAASYRLDLTA